MHMPSLLEDCDTHMYTYIYALFVHIAIWAKTMLCDGQKQQNYTVHNMHHMKLACPIQIDLADIQGQHVLRHFCYPPGSANSNKVGLPFRLVNVMPVAPLNFGKMSEFQNSRGLAVGFF